MGFIGAIKPLYKCPCRHIVHYCTLLSQSSIKYLIIRWHCFIIYYHNLIQILIQILQHVFVGERDKGFDVCGPHSRARHRVSYGRAKATASATTTRYNIHYQNTDGNWWLFAITKLVFFLLWSRCWGQVWFQRRWHPASKNKQFPSNTKKKIL